MPENRSLWGIDLGPAPRRQLDLMRAAALHDERGLAAWERWSAAVAVDDVRYGEQRLLAAAFRPLRTLGVEHPLLDLAGNVYRRTWYMNQVRTARCAEIVEHLRGKGIRSLVLKGLALAHLHYRDLGARPMQDLDLLVEPDRLDDAVRELETLGIHPLYEFRRPIGALGKEVPMDDEGGNVVEVHAFSLVESADDADLWERRIGFSVAGVEAHAPGTSDMLLHVCAHGLRWNPNHPVAWAVDAAAILDSVEAEVDWDRFFERARARRLTVSAGRAIQFLVEWLELAVPAEVEECLTSVRTTRAERVADWARRGRPTRTRTAVQAWDRYARFRDLAPPHRQPASAASWFGERWEVSSAGGAVAQAARRTISSTPVRRNENRRGETGADTGGNRPLSKTL